MEKIQVEGSKLATFLTVEIMQNNTVPIYMEEKYGAILERKGIKMVKIANLAPKVIGKHQEVMFRIFLAKKTDELIGILREYNIKDSIAVKKYPFDIGTDNNRLVTVYQSFSGDSSENKGGIYFQPLYIGSEEEYNADNVFKLLGGRSLTLNHPMEMITEMLVNVKDNSQRKLMMDNLKWAIKGTAYEHDFGTIEAIKLCDAFFSGNVGHDQFYLEMETLIDKCLTMKPYKGCTSANKFERCIKDAPEYCAFCKIDGKQELARYDAITRHGTAWAFMCEKCYKEHGVPGMGLGINKGQALIYADEK